MKLEDIGFYSLSDNRAKNSSPKSKMQRCEMIINEACNFRCGYCKGLGKQVFKNRIKKELSIGEIKRNIDYWSPLENIRFSGGEPTIHKHLLSAVVYARDKMINRIAISTNGSANSGKYYDLIAGGCNDFSISLDAADALTGDVMAGNIKGSWCKVVKNIEKLSAITYVTVGVVLNPKNINTFIEIVQFADSLGVSDIRVIPSAQWNEPLVELKKINQTILNRHPILKYRVTNFINGKRIRGLDENSVSSCPLVWDDSVIAGNDHYPCVIYMREQGNPIGKVSDNMREDRIEWFNNTNTKQDIICSKNCLDVCVDYNKKVINKG